MFRTFAKRRHGENATKHALVVSVEDTTQTGEQRNAEDFHVLHQSGRATFAHKGLTSLQSYVKR